MLIEIAIFKPWFTAVTHLVTNKYNILYYTLIINVYTLYITYIN